MIYIPLISGSESAVLIGAWGLIFIYGFLLYYRNELKDLRQKVKSLLDGNIEDQDLEVLIKSQNNNSEHHTEIIFILLYGLLVLLLTLKLLLKF